MTDFYKELVEKLTNPMKQKPYKESSVKPVYKYLKQLNGGEAPTSLDFLLDRPIVIRILGEKYAVSTQRSIVFAIRNVAKDFKREDILEMWKENIDETEAGKGLLPKGEKSEAQKKAYALVEGDDKGNAWNSILKKAEDYAEGHNNNAYLLSQIYTKFPPRRNLDYTEMKITTDYKPTMSKEFNYLVVGTEGDGIGMRFIFNRYKTDGTYNQQIFNVPEDLTEILVFIIDKDRKGEGDYLVSTKTGNKYRSDDITDELHKVFGSGISTQMLRHMYLDKYNTPENEKVIKEMMGDAEMMAHSISTQQATYVKK